MVLPKRIEFRVPLPRAFAREIRRVFPTEKSDSDDREDRRGVRDRLRGLTAFIAGSTLGVIDGATIRLWGGSVRGAPHRTLRIRSGALRPLVSGMTRPCLVPIAGLGHGKLLLLVKGYDSDKTYVSVPVVCDPRAARPYRVIEPAGRERLGGSEPRRLGLDRTGATAWLGGEIDGGAVAHIDEFIMVGTGYRLDLAAGTYDWDERRPAKAVRSPLISAGIGESVARGLLGIYPGDQAGLAARDDTLVISIERPRGKRRVVHLPLGRRLADASQLYELVAVAVAWPELLVLDATSGEVVVHRRRLT